MDSIVSALIAGGLALIGVIITNISSNKRIENQLTTSQAVTDTKLENLTQEVKKHNDFAIRVPILECKIKLLEDKVEELKKND